MSAQLSLGLGAPRWDRLCAELPITPGRELEDGSLVSLWLRGPAAGDARRPAWAVTPVPSGCLAWELGARWFYEAQTRTITAEGSQYAGGPRRGNRQDVAEWAQDTLQRLEQSRQRLEQSRRLYLPGRGGVPFDG